MMVTLYLHGLPGQQLSREKLRDDGDVVVVEGYACPEERYRRSDGRRVDENNKPTPWDFWRLRV